MLCDGGTFLFSIHVFTSSHLNKSGYASLIGDYWVGAIIIE